MRVVKSLAIWRLKHFEFGLHGNTTNIQDFDDYRTLPYGEGPLKLLRLPKTRQDLLSNYDPYTDSRTMDLNTGQTRDDCFFSDQ